MKLNADGLAAVTAIVRESSDLSVEEATTAATALLMAYFEARERSADPVSPGAPPAARREPTDAMIDAATDVLRPWLVERAPIGKPVHIVEDALRAALAAARDGPA